MSDLLLVATPDWEKFSGLQLTNAIDTYGDLNNVKIAVGSGDIGTVSIAVDENKFPTPYTAVEAMFLGDELWIKSVLTSTL